MDDNQIIDLYLHRDEEAIVHTAQRYGRRLRAISMNILQDTQTAEECENDTYLQAWNSIPPHEPRSYLFAFLARIIRHISIDCCRYRDRLCRSAYVEELSQELQCCISGGDQVQQHIEAVELAESISIFLRTRPEQMRNVFLRRYWYMDSIAEIAHRFGTSQSRVKSMLLRCRNALREHLEKEGYTL